MIPEHELRQMYHVEGMTQLEIAELCGVNNTTVSRWIREQGIEPRTYSEAVLYGITIPSGEYLIQMYWGEMMSQCDIAELIGVSRSTVYNWMKNYGIESRTNSEAHSGENSPNWQGGISFEPYCEKFNDSFKEAVRERDGYICQLCGCEQNVRKLDVHHIRYDKENCWPDVVTLCRSCNIRVNSDRDYWERYFEDLLMGRGMLNWSIEV